MARPWCKNYRGMHEKDQCEAGIAFKELPGYGIKGFFDSCPCFGPMGNKCEKAVYPTAEEMAERDREIHDGKPSLSSPPNHDREYCGGPWKRGMNGHQGVIACPVCMAENSLQFSRSSYNGHIHASCKTDKCVSWME